MGHLARVRDFKGLGRGIQDLVRFGGGVGDCRVNGRKDYCATIQCDTFQAHSAPYQVSMVFTIDTPIRSCDLFLMRRNLCVQLVKLTWVFH